MFKLNFIRLGKSSLSLIIFLIPLSFIIGPALTEFFLFTSIIVFFFLNRDKSYFLNNKVIFLSIFSFYIFLNSFFQITNEYGIDLKISSFFHFRYVFFSLSIFFLCSMLNVNKHKIFYVIFIFLILTLLFDSIFQFFNGTNILGYKIPNNGRISSFFGDELILGSFLTRLLPIIMWSIFHFRIDLKKNFLRYTIFFSLYFICIYIAGGRTSFFLLSFIIFSSLVFLRKLRILITISLLILISFGTLIKIFNLGSVDTSHRIFIKTFNQITEKKLKTQNTPKESLINRDIFHKFNLYSNDHQGHIILALDLFKDQKLFGIGPKGFRHYCRQINYSSEYGICSTHPHNVLIQIITELGLFGLFFYMISLGYILFYVFKIHIYNKSEADYLSLISISIGLIVNLFPLIPGGNFFNNWISIILYYNIGIFLYSYKNCFNKY